MKHLLLLFSSFLFLTAWGQMSDSFDDGDFTNNPTWSGDAADFIVNANNELQLNASTAGESYLSTAHNLTQLEDREWRYKINYSFSPSNNNYGLTYLTATDADLSTNPDGVYFRIGENGSADKIELIERDGGIETTILTANSGDVASSFEITVKIIYRSNGDWEVYTDLNGGIAYQQEATANYPVSVLGQYIGIDLIYTISNAQKFKYDDFYAGPIQVDTDPPHLDAAVPISNTELEVQFNEAIDQTTGEQVVNYNVDNGIGAPTSVQQDGTDFSKFVLTFSSNFIIGQDYVLTVENVEDFAGNAMSSENTSFQYIEAQIPAFGDIIINEFMADENPSVGLPEYEYVELYNRSNKYFHLNGWQLSDNSSPGTIQDVWLNPGEYVVLVPTAGLTDYPQATGVTSWAALNNSGDEIHLHTDNGILVDELTYTDKWYKDKNKSSGGWSIERINPDLPCSGEDNWRASTDSNGGTPGTQNSVYNTQPDTKASTVTSVLVNPPKEIVLTFSEGMDSLSLINATFSSHPVLTEDSRSVNGKYPTVLTIVFSDTIIPGQVYSYTIDGFEDCSGNTSNYQGTFVLPQHPEKGDLIINEILFNPLSGGSDFVEIYNNSNKYIDLKNWELAHFGNDTISSQKKIDISYIIGPDDYAVITKDSSFQLMNYPFAVPGKFVQLSTLPSYNNDSSTVYLIFNDTIMDRVAYTEDWHFSLLQNKKGVSLERHSPDLPSNSSSNWYSASESVGFATPGRENSQNMNPGQTGGTLSLSSSTFSPDNDGFEDVLLLTYEVNDPNLIGDLTIYDDKGREIKVLFKDQLLGGKGTVQWEGTREDGTKASIGPYIIVFEIFDVDKAKVQNIRKVVTLAGRL